MINLKDIRYLRLGTRNLDDAVTFATDILGLQLVAREDKAVYFRSDKVDVRGDTRDHTLVYFEGDPADHTVGFDLIAWEDLDRVGGALEDAGFPVHLGTRAECDARRVKGFIASRDPSGNKIEIVARPFHTGERYFPARDAGITGFSHIGLFTTDPVQDEKFWTQVFNARVSDWLDDAPLMRIDTIHHSLALFPSTAPGVQHINHQVESEDDVMRSYYFLQDKGVKIAWGPGRHPLSTAIMLYFVGPDGMIYEYSVGVKQILPEEEATYRPRQFPFDRFAACMWGSVPDRAVLSRADREPPALKRVK